MYKKMKETLQLINETQNQKNNIQHMIEQIIMDCIIRKGGCEENLMIYPNISPSEEGFVVEVLFRGVDGLAFDLVQAIAWEFDVDNGDMVIESTRVPHEIVLRFIVKEKGEIRTCNDCKHMTSTVTDEELGADGDYHWCYIQMCMKDGIPALATEIEDVYDANNCEYYEDKYEEEE